MAGFPDLKAVVWQEKLRPVRSTATGRGRLGKLLKAGSELRGWSMMETEMVTEKRDASPWL